MRGWWWWKGATSGKSMWVHWEGETFSDLRAALLCLQGKASIVSALPAAPHGPQTAKLPPITNTANIKQGGHKTGSTMLCTRLGPHVRSGTIKRST